MLGYFQTDSKSMTENSPRRLQNKRQIQSHMSNTYRSGNINKFPSAVARQFHVNQHCSWSRLDCLYSVSLNTGTSSIKHFVHPVTVATFGDQLCHLEPKYLGIFQKKGPMSLHLRHIYLTLHRQTYFVVLTRSYRTKPNIFLRFRLSKNLTNF